MTQTITESSDSPAAQDTYSGQTLAARELEAVRENLATLQRFSDLAALLFFQRLFALAPVFLKRLSADSDVLCRQFNFTVRSALDGVTGGERHWARSLRVVASQLAACNVRSAEQRWFELALVWVIERLDNRRLQNS